MYGYPLSVVFERWASCLLVFLNFWLTHRKYGQADCLADLPLKYCCIDMSEKLSLLNNYPMYDAAICNNHLRDYCCIKIGVRGIIQKKLLLFSFVLLHILQHTALAKEHELVEFVKLAMVQSNVALDVRDSRTLSGLDVKVAEHQFETRIVPLTTIGFTQGTGSQQLGMEFQREMEAGTEVAYGVVGDRVDENSEYVIENTTSARAFVRISQGLFRRWGEKYNLTGVHVAHMRSGLNELSAVQTLQTLILDTSRKYYSLLLEDHLLTKSEQALERSKEHLNSAKSRQSVGLVSKVDVYRAELAALSAENAWHNQIRARQRALDDFREHLGLHEDSKLDWQEPIDKIMPIVPEEWEETIFDNRLEWRRYLANAQILQREMYKAERDLLPDVGLSFTVEQRGEGDSIDEAVELDETNWSFQVRMNSPFSSLPEESALLRKKMEQAKLRREGATLKRKIIREVKDGLADLQTAERQHQVNRRQLEQAELALDLAKIRYEKGLSDNLDMLDAEAALSDAELAISRSLVEYNNAAIHLAYVMGILNTDWLQMSVR